MIYNSERNEIDTYRICERHWPDLAHKFRLGAAKNEHANERHKSTRTTYCVCKRYWSDLPHEFRLLITYVLC
jgi:hypothetical protein